MGRTASIWQLAGLAFTSIFGVLLHFLFDWTGGNIFVAAFSAVNESIWEHMKLLFFPMFVFALIESRYMGKHSPCFWRAKVIGIVLGVALIPVLYYNVNGIFGAAPDWVNIVIFFVTAAASYFVENWIFKNTWISCKSSKTALAVLWIITLVFVVFTFVPLHIPLFKDPVTGGYGIS